MDYPAADFLRFFESHGLFTAVSQPTWHTVIGGSHQYVKQMLAGYKGELRLNTRVATIERDEGSVVVAGERFDAVVCATHSDQALRMLIDADAGATRGVGGHSLQRKPLRPAHRRIIPAANAAVPGRAGTTRTPTTKFTTAPICGSYWMNLLQGIPGPVNYVVTLNPVREVPKEKILFETIYHHPHYGPASVMTHKRLPLIQGRGGIWFAGAWASYGFHEDGLKSGLRAVRGIDATCLPAWASGL